MRVARIRKGHVSYENLSTVCRVSYDGQAKIAKCADMQCSEAVAAIAIFHARLWLNVIRIINRKAIVIARVLNAVLTDSGPSPHESLGHDL